MLQDLPRIDFYEKPYTAAMTLNKIMAEGCYSLRQVHNVLGHSEAWLEMRLSLAELAPEIGQSMDDCPSAIMYGFCLAKLSHKLQREVLLEAMNLDLPQFSAYCVKKRRGLL